MTDIPIHRESKFHNYKFYQMTNTVIVASLIISVALFYTDFIEARAAASYSFETTTTTDPPAAYIEDSFSSATSESSEDDSECQTSCFEQVEITQSHIRVHMDLMKKQNNFINNRKNKVASLSTTSRKPKPGQQQNSTSTLMSRTLNNQNKPIVVSRLRVARSTSFKNNEPSLTEIRNTRNNSMKSDHPELKKLRHKTRQQLNETCESIRRLKNCLEGISRGCLGDLQFHSLEVFASQWFSKFDCPPAHNPNFVLFAQLTRSIPKEEPEKMPLARPISSVEETQAKLEAIFSGGAGFGGAGSPKTSLGVMLKPGLTRTASQKFNTMSNNNFDSSDIDVHGQLKARNMLSGNEILDHGTKKSYLTPLTGQLLLVPCFLVLLVFIITLTNKIKECYLYSSNE